MAIDPKLLNDGENVVISTRTHAKALLVPMLVGLLVLAAAAWTEVAVTGGSASLAMWIVVGLLLTWFVLRPLLEWLTATYTITNRRLITRHGIITRRGHDIPLARISDVAYEHGPIDRMLGCGTLIISDASTHGRVLLHDIPQVEDTHRRLNQLLHDLHVDDGT